VNNGRVFVSVTVSNTGERAGADVVQVYVRDPATTGEPPEQLRAFARVTLPTMSSRTVDLSIPVSALDVYLNKSYKLVAGTYSLSVGQSSDDLSMTRRVRLS
jgi:beta-glucosidase